jgi:hypothetical protein
MKDLIIKHNYTLGLPQKHAIRVVLVSVLYQAPLIQLDG